MRRSRILYLLLVVLLMLPGYIPGTGERIDASASGSQFSYRVRTTVFGSAGYPASSPQYGANGTLGQPSCIGTCLAAGKTGHIGFWKGGWMALIADADPPPVFRDRLFQNYPNPFNPTTTIEYSVANGGCVDLKIFNIQGQRIRTLVNEHKRPGLYKVSWDGRNDAGRAVATGIYFYRIRTSSFVSVKKMLILR